jgi:hypothetical protein
MASGGHHRSLSVTPRTQDTVFISYRRADEAWAIACYSALQERGFDVFIDYLGLGGGKFEREILENIEKRAHFVVLLTEDALEKANEPHDWMRHEIEQS